MVILNPAHEKRLVMSDPKQMVLTGITRKEPTLVLYLYTGRNHQKVTQAPQEELRKREPRQSMHVATWPERMNSCKEWTHLRDARAAAFVLTSHLHKDPSILHRTKLVPWLRQLHE